MLKCFYWVNILALIKKLETWHPASQWTATPNPTLGQLTTNYAFVLAKQQSTSPTEAALQIVQNLNTKFTAENLPVQATAKGPYVNLELLFNTETNFSYLTENWLLEKEERSVLLDFVASNVAKPLHVGHARNINYGEFIRRILSLKYTKVVTENYWGDWGVQFGVLLWGWWQLEKLGQVELVLNSEKVSVKFQPINEVDIDTLVKVYIWANQQKEFVANWDVEVKKIVKQLEDGFVEGLELLKHFVGISKTGVLEDMKQLNAAAHDLEFGESYYVKPAKELYQFLEEHNLWKAEGQARFIDFVDLSPEILVKLPKLVISQLKELGRCYLVSSNGYTSYAFRDVAARMHWALELNSDLMISITANEQIHHFKQVFGLMAWLICLPQFNQKYNPNNLPNLNFENLKHLYYGYITLADGKMSTRKGNFLTLNQFLQQLKQHAKQVLQAKNSEEDVADLVAIAALKWADLSKDISKDLVFNEESIFKFEGNTGVYQLYTIARLKSILEKQGLPIDYQNFELDPNLLNQTELELLKFLHTFPVILESSIANYKSHLICNYLFEVATKVNSWYAKYSINAETDAARKQTLLNFASLIIATQTKILDLLAIQVVDKL